MQRGEAELLRVQQKVSEAGGKLRKLWADERGVWQRLEKQQRELEGAEGHVQAVRGFIRQGAQFVDRYT